MHWITIALSGSLLFWAGLMWFSQFATYPLFGSVSRDDFGPLHAQYEKGLPLGVYAPFAVMICMIAIAVFVRPQDIGASWLWLAVAAGAGAILTTAACAAPLHIWLIRNGQNIQRIRWLLRCNAARTGFALLGGVAAVGIIASQG